MRPNACVLQRAVTRNTGPIFKPVVTSCRASNVSNLTLEWQFYICCRFCMCCSGIRTIGCRLGVDGYFLMKKVKECQNADFWLFSDGLTLSSRQLSVELLGQLETCSLKHIETILNTKETLTDMCIYIYIKLYIYIVYTFFPLLFPVRCRCRRYTRFQRLFGVEGDLDEDVGVWMPDLPRSLPSKPRLF